MAIAITGQGDVVQFYVKVVPGASRDRIIGELGEALKVAVSRPPQRGAANDAVISLLAEALGVTRGSVSIVRGHTSPRKQIVVRGLTVAQVQQRLCVG
jgi:uncharacterized protein (TIGR00251 family)